MARQQKTQKAADAAPITAIERLGLRVSAMIGSDQLARRVLAMIDSPVAWLGKRVRVHRLETDGDREWSEVMDRLAAISGLQMDFDEAGSVILQWERAGELNLRLGQNNRPAVTAIDHVPF